MTGKAELGPIGSFHNVPGRISGYIDRPRELNQLAGWLTVSNQNCDDWRKPTLVNVHGPPGVGKTSLVSEFLYQNREKLRNHQVIWLAGESVQDQMISLCEAKPEFHGIVIRRANGDLVKNKLLVDEMFDLLCFYPTIIVVDDVTNQDAKVDDYINHVGQSRRRDKKYPMCIMISREIDRSTENDWVKVKVGPLSEDNFVIPNGIKERFGKDDILKIAKFAGFHPVISKILRGCGTQLRKSDVAPEELVQSLLQVALKDKNSEDQSWSDTLLRLKRIWECVINFLAQSDEVGQTAVDILNASILLPATGVPLDFAVNVFSKYFLLKHEEQRSDEPNQSPGTDLVRNAVSLLQDFGLFEGVDEVYISHLLCEYLESELKKNKEFQCHIIQLAKTVLALASPKSATYSSFNLNSAYRLACVTRVSQWVQELDKSDETIVVKLEFARLLAQQVPSVALALLDELENKEEGEAVTFTEQDRTIAELRSRCYRNMVRPSESVNTLQKACEKAIRCHGTESRDVVLLKREFAEALYCNGEYKEAISEIENLLESSQLTEAEKLRVRTDLAYYYYKSNLSEKAVELMRQVYDASCKQFGEDDEFTVNRLKEIQHYKMKLEKYDECLHHAEKLVQGFVRIYGPDHEKSFKSRRWMLECILKLEPNRCLQVLPQAKKLCEDLGKAYGSCHRYTVEVMNLIVLLINTANSDQDVTSSMREENNDDALNFAIRAWQVRKKLYGEEFYFTVKSKNLVAKAYLHMGNLDEAEKIIMQIEEVIHRLFDEHKNVLRISKLFKDHTINWKELTKARRGRCIRQRTSSSDNNWRA